MRVSIVLLSISLCASAVPTAPYYRLVAGRQLEAEGFRPGRPSFPGRPAANRPPTTTAAPTSALPPVPVPSTTAADPAPSSPSANNTNTDTGANCLAGVTLPSGASGLPAPVGSLVLIAQGTGTQNYTCANSSATPASFGAVASLTNISCSATTTALAGGEGGALGVGATVGSHFFLDLTTPDFDVSGLGNTALKKQGSVAAPANSDGDVAWLFLEAQAGGLTTSAVKSIYRVETRGGSAPATCEGQPAVVTVPYEAQYWFFA